MGNMIPYIVDGVLILYLVIRFVIGYRKGFLHEFLSLVLSLGFLFVLIKYMNPIREKLAPIINIPKWIGEKANPWVNYLVSLSHYLIVTIIIFLAFRFVLLLLLLGLKKFVQRMRDDSPGLGKIDRVLGFLFGLVNGVVTVAIICFLLYQPTLFPKQQESLSKAKLASSVYDVSVQTVEKVTHKSTDEITTIVMHYLAGTSIGEAEKVSNSSAERFALLITDLPKLVKNPEKTFNVEDSQRQAAALRFILELSALAELTDKVPYDAELDRRFGVIYDQLVAYVPGDIGVIGVQTATYNELFEEEKGTFYQVGLSNEQISKLKDICTPVD